MDHTLTMTAFEPKELLGEGGMGEVWRARDHALGRDVALKRLRPHHRNKREECLRFIEEARWTGQLEHPHIPPVYQLGADEAGPCFALKLVQGETLAQVIQLLRDGDSETQRRYRLGRRVRILLRIATALDYAHSRGFLHRDIKPENIMIGEFGEVFLMDWGLAKNLQPEPDHEAPPTITRDGMFFGTPQYAAPEQLCGQSEKFGPTLDIYGLGACLYEFVSLRRPFPEQDLSGLVKAVLTRAPDPLGPDVPPQLLQLITKTLHKDPSQRTQTMKQLIEEIREFLDGDSSLVEPPQANRIPRPLWPLIALWCLYPLLPLGRWLMAQMGW